LQDKIELDQIIVNVGLRFDYFDANGKAPTDFKDPSLTQPIKVIDIYQDGELLNASIPYRLNSDGSRALINPETGKSLSTLPDDVTFIDGLGNDLSYYDWTATGSWFEESKPCIQFSPRIGISYPITDKGAIFFSYGFFFQKPTFEHLYKNPEFEMNLSSSGNVSTLMGNANLKNQKTVNYEIGVQQQVGNNAGIFITAFYKDINNWIGTEITETYIGGDKYA